MPFPVGGLGACPQKKKIVLKIMSKFGTYFLYYTRKWGGDYPPVLKVGGPITLPPPRAITPVMTDKFANKFVELLLIISTCDLCHRYL